jgi:hypothetical protein
MYVFGYHAEVWMLYLILSVIIGSVLFKVIFLYDPPIPLGHWELVDYGIAIVSWAVYVVTWPGIAAIALIALIDGG